MAGAESAQGPFNAKEQTHTSPRVCVGRTCFGRSHKASRGGAQILPVREASQAIKIFESNLGNDQPQPTLMDDGEKKNSKGPTMNTDPFKRKKKKKTCRVFIFCCQSTPVIRHDTCDVA